MPSLDSGFTFQIWGFDCAEKKNQREQCLSKKGFDAFLFILDTGGGGGGGKLNAKRGLFMLDTREVIL